MTIHARWVVISAVALSGCSAVRSPGTGSPRPSEGAALEQKTIQELEQRFVAAVANKDVEAAVALYASDAVELPPGGSPIVGTAAIRANWTAFTKVMNLAMPTIVDRVEVAAAGDMAVEIGHFSLDYDAPAGHVNSNWKYVNVWKKIAGQWRLAYETWNSNPGTAGQ